MNKIFTPWTKEQVDALNRYQKHGYFHPFTCGNHRSDEIHQKYAKEHGDRDLGLLIATENGWICPACHEWYQNWAWDMMLEESKDPLEQK